MMADRAAPCSCAHRFCIMGLTCAADGRAGTFLALFVKHPGLARRPGAAAGGSMLLAGAAGCGVLALARNALRCAREHPNSRPPSTLPACLPA